MTIPLIFKAASIWLGIACLAIANGLLRESVLIPQLGIGIALPLSGLTLSMIVFLVTYFSFPFIGTWKRAIYLLIGIQWVLMTLTFELLFGIFVADKSWTDLLQIFNVTQGELFTLVLIVSLLSPYIAARARGAI